MCRVAVIDCLDICINEHLNRGTFEKSGIVFVMMGCVIQQTPGGGTTTLYLNPIKAYPQ